MINDRYQVIKTIGEGGMANVYLAQDTILDRKVAIKVLRGDLAQDEKFIRRFQREALSASKLVHPNIVEVYDVGEYNGNYYIVMEYINGITLKNLIKKRGALTLPEVIDIMSQLLSGIMCAHDSYIIHRDIKPQNVMILEDGRVKVTDFGIATAINSNELTQTNSVMGSVHYLPPEQANGSGSTIKSDIYSLGILMYELLTGKLPFKGDNAVEIAIKQMQEPIPSICSQNPAIPQSIENIVLKACAKNPKNRYDSVNDMYRDLRNALNEDTMKQPRVVYQYSENSLDETKVLPNITELSKKAVKEESKVSKKRQKKDTVLLVTASICAFMIALICLIVIIYPSFTAVEEIRIPDVSNLTIVEAENILRENGFTVATDIREKESDTVEVGKVIKTDPEMGRKLKKGTVITLIVSKESGKVTIRNYIGQPYKTVQVNLQNAGINVVVESVKISSNEQSKYKENTITEQSVDAGVRLAQGDTIVLYYAVFANEYPDFTSGYTVSEVEAFCRKYGVTLNKTYEVDDSRSEGAIIKQNRQGEVYSGQVLTITIVKHSE